MLSQSDNTSSDVPMHGHSRLDDERVGAAPAGVISGEAEGRGREPSVVAPEQVVVMHGEEGSGETAAQGTHLRFHS